jgi:hypothetical protein
MTTRLQALVGYLAGKDGPESDAVRASLGDPASETSQLLTAARARSGALFSEPVLKRLGLLARLPGTGPEPPRAPVPPRPRAPVWLRAVPWLLSAAACVAGLVFWLDCRQHHRHLEDELRKAVAARAGKPAEEPPRPGANGLPVDQARHADPPSGANNVASPIQPGEPGATPNPAVAAPEGTPQGSGTTNPAGSGTEEIARLHSQLKAARSQIARLVADLKANKDHTRQLEQEVARLGEAETELSAAQAQLKKARDGWQAALAAGLKEKRDLGKRLEAEKAKVKAAEASVASARTQLRNLQTTLRELRARNATLEADLKEAQARIKQLQKPPR